MTDLLSLLVLCGGAFGLILVVKATERRRISSNLSAYRLSFPRDLKSEDVARAFTGLSGLLLPWWKRWIAVPHVALEVHATSRGIEHYVIVPESFSAIIKGVLQSALPAVRFVPVDLPELNVRSAAEYRLTSHDRPLAIDPTGMSAGLLANLQPLNKNETIVVQWLVTPHPPVAPAKLPKNQPSGLSFARPIDGDDVSALRTKQSEAMVLGVGRIGVRAATGSAETAILRRVESAWHGSRAPGVHLTRRMVNASRVARSISGRMAPPSAWPATLNASELVGLSGWPIGIVGLPGLFLGGCRILPASPDVSRTGTLLADSNYSGDARPLAVGVEARLRHLSLLGPTGTGKSNLLAQIILSDIEAGHGCLVIDPKADLIETILERLPEHRRHDVIVFDPTDLMPVGLNPLQSATGAGREVVVENLVGLFRSLYANSWGPRLEWVLRSALQTLSHVEGTTLCEVPLILTNPSYRRKIVGKLDNLALEEFWGFYEAMSDAERQTAIGPVINKLSSFTGRPMVRSIIGQSNPRLQIAEVMAEGKILLCSLPTGLLGDDASALLGALIVAELWHATTARAGMAKEDRRPFFAHLDEFQHFIHLPTPMSAVLAEARGLGLGMTLAHQHLDQLTPEAKSAVLSNARSRVIFQLPAADARVMARELGSMLTPEDLQGLAAYEVVTQLFAKGQTQAPATGRTREIGEPSANADAIRLTSRLAYGADRDEVEQTIRARQGAVITEGSVGRKKRGGGPS